MLGTRLLTPIYIVLWSRLCNVIFFIYQHQYPQLSVIHTGKLKLESFLNPLGG